MSLVMRAMAAAALGVVIVTAPAALTHMGAWFVVSVAESYLSSPARRM